MFASSFIVPWQGTEYRWISTFLPQTICFWITIVSLNMMFHTHFHTLFSQIFGEIQLLEVLLLPDSPRVLTAACFAQAWWGTIDGAARRAASLMDETWASQPATPQTLEKHQQRPTFKWFCMFFFFVSQAWNLCKGFKFSGVFNSHLN